MILSRSMRHIVFAFAAASRLLHARGASVALIVCLSAPMLIAATGLAVDVGYWYQNQTSLQSAADAAALAAASADYRYLVANPASSSTVSGSVATSAATAAADNATGSQFGFAAGATGTGVTVPPPVINASSTTYSVTLKIPRSDFLSHVAGMGLSGLAAGSQYASASATVDTTKATSAGACLMAIGKNGTGITGTGNIVINGSSCSVVSNADITGSACTGGKSPTGSIALSGSSSITSGSVYAAGCEELTGSSSITAATNEQNTNSQVSDPLSAMGLPPIWPTMILSSSASSTAPPFSANSTVATISSPSSPCVLSAGPTTALEPCNYTPGMNISAVAAELQSGTKSTTYGSTYAILGGTAGPALATTASTDTSLKLDTATYYLSGLSTWTNPTTTEASNWAMSLDSPTITSGVPVITSANGSIFYLNGGLTTGTDSGIVSFGSGTFLLDRNSASSNGAMYLDGGTTTFAGGTYFINGGLDVGGNATVNFGPGIYYIENGNLTFSNGATVTATNATFVLEGTGSTGASFDMVGGSAGLNLSAPVPNNATHPTNCVLPSASSDPTAAPYPQSAYSLISVNTANATNVSNTSAPAAPFPYDGTNGEGICGVLIYQVPTDTATDTLANGYSAKINGIIYTPGATLQLTGDASISAAENSNGSAGTLAFLANSINLANSATITINVAAGSPVSGTTTTTPNPALLTQ